MTIRLVPEEPKSLSIGDSMDSAKAAWSRARAAQRALVANLRLTEDLYREGNVNARRLQLHRAEALSQLGRAQAVVDALTESLEEFERYRTPTPPTA